MPSEDPLKGNFGFAEIDGLQLRQFNETVPGDAGTGWKTLVVSVALPGTLSISGFNVEIDSISAVYPPSDVAATLGIPGVALRTGGGEPWKVAPDGSIGSIGYLAQALISPESPKTWFEFDVAGPAKMVVTLGDGPSTPSAILVDVNGKNIWNDGLDWSGMVAIEVPAGNHVLRCTAMSGFPVHLNPAHYLSVKSISIASISGADLMSAGIGLQEPVAYTGQWERRAFAGAINGNAIAGKANTGTGGLRIVKSIVAGPCYVQFRTHLPVMTPQQSGLHLKTVSPMPISQSISRGYGDAGGWKDFPFENDIWNRLVWLPPGKQVLRWSGSAISSVFSEVAIDDVTLTATPVLSVAEGSGAPGLQWTNDSEIPWTGYERPHDSVRGVASGAVKLGEITELAVKVNGIGRLSYEWQPTGGSLSGWVKKGDAIVFSQETATSGERSLLVDSEGETTIRWKIQSISYDEGWMDVRNVVWKPLTRKGLFDAWAESLPAGKRSANDDADDDGFRNLIEYAFGVDAAGKSDKPVISDTRRGLAGRRMDAGPGGSLFGPGGVELPEGIIGFYDLMIPYVEGAADVVVEISDDLDEWRVVPVTLLRSKPAVNPMDGWNGWPKHGDTHQSLAIPITAADTKLYFRVRATVAGS